MKPEWLKCKNCLWFEKRELSNRDEYGFCYHSHKTMLSQTPVTAIHQTNYCNHWTCSTCWLEWLSYALNCDTGEYIIDHSKCKPVKFSNEEDK